MTTKERLIIFIHYLNIGQNKFEKNCGLSYGSVSSFKEAPNGTSIIKIATTYPELSLDWLLLGEGEMLRSNNSTEKTPDVEVSAEEHPVTEKRYTDDMNVQDRLELFIRAKGLGNYQFEKKVGLSQGYVKRVKNCLHPEKIKRIANVFPELSIDWMIIGRGEMMVNQPNKLYEKEIYKLLKERISLQEEMIQKLKTDLKTETTKRIALDKENKQLLKNLQDISQMYAEQISTTLANIQEKLTA